MLKKLFDLVSIIVTALAIITASTACIFWFYQPKIPKSLL